MKLEGSIKQTDTTQQYCGQVLEWECARKNSPLWIYYLKCSAPIVAHLFIIEPAVLATRFDTLD